ncbi:MAG: VOC family protein [Gallionella sp.]|nr:VOC family protein [Gallionella sp.]
MITGIHHVTHLVSDLARARDFYENLLGLKPDTARPVMSFDGVWYVVAQAQQLHLMVLPDAGAGVPRPVHGGRDRHVALTVSDIGQLAARLDGAGIIYTRSLSGRRALFCRDPDQNALEFIELV